MREPPLEAWLFMTENGTKSHMGHGLGPKSSFPASIGLHWPQNTYFGPIWPNEASLGLKTISNGPPQHCYELFWGYQVFKVAFRPPFGL